MSKPVATPETFGHCLGIAPGNVPAYSSDYATANPEQLPDRHAFRHYHNDIYTGYKWQCVEFARRWLLINHGYVFDDIAMAYDIFRLQSVKRVDTHERLPLHSFHNGSKHHPEVGAMLIWNEGGEFEITGHVAIITDVYPDRICIAEQNVEHTLWGGKHYSRELPARITQDGHYWIRCSYHDASILGWVIQTPNDEHAVKFPTPDANLFKLQRGQVAAELEAKGEPWLNPANPDEAAYLEMNGERLCSIDAERYTYYAISDTAEQEIKRATNELHALFMHATDYVLEHDHLLKHFNIPRELWPRLHQSWNNRRNQMITGRFDFCLTERGLKLYEYNCDSASCHMEAGKVQGLWAKHYGCDHGEDAGEDLAQHLIDAWKNANPQGLVHILLDNDQEEMYHALFMKECMDAAGIESKLVMGLNHLRWGDNDQVLDEDGTAIEWVWKTWAWETALEQLRDELQTNTSKPESPRLMDVLLRPQTLVYEPLWTLIPSNKAMLPLLYELFPEHPYLLESSFTLTDSLRRKGYVEKPIAGRSGHNIRLFAADEKLIDGTPGRFDSQTQIFQELCPLPEFSGFKAQVCSFSAAGTYAGTCIRADRSYIITQNSDLFPLRVVSDKDYRQV